MAAEQESAIRNQESGIGNQESAVSKQESKLSNQESEPAADVRLALDTKWHGPRWSVLSRLLMAAIDAGIVLLVAVAAAWVAGQDRPAAIATVALAYFCLVTPLFGESPAKWIIARRRSIVDALMAGPAAVAALWKRGSDVISHVAGTDEPVEEPDTHRWISDARRVGPSPRLRVRFKVSR